MLWTIAKKEFLEKTLDSRVIISFVIAVALTIVATLVAGTDYKAKKIEYDTSIAKAQSDIAKVRVYSQYNPVVVYPPSPLNVFSQGINIPTPITVDIRIDEVPRFEARSAGLNPMMSMFDTLDIATVVRILFSLLVILLTFDSFSGEKEAGTLRQALSNPVARINLLYGKFIGLMMIVGVVVCLTYLIAILMVRLASSAQLLPLYYVRILLMTVMTVLYLAIFAALGIFASIKFQHSSTSLVVLLFTWFFIAILQPNLSTYIVTESQSKQWMNDVRSTVNEMECQPMKELEQLQKEHNFQLVDPSKRWYSTGKGTSTGRNYNGVSIHSVIADADYDLLEYTVEQVHLLGQMGECAEKEFDFFKTMYLDRLSKQLQWKRTIDLLSPAALFSRGGAILSETDVDNIDEFFERTHQYRNQYLMYLDQKGIFTFNAQLYFSRLNKDQVERTATEQRMAQYNKDPDLVPYIDDQPALDLRDAPVFLGNQSNIVTDFGKVAQMSLVLLCYLGIVFFVAGRNIKSYDPR